MKNEANKFYYDSKEYVFRKGKDSIFLQRMPVVFSVRELEKFINRPTEELALFIEDIKEWIRTVLNSNILNHSKVRILSLYGEEFSIAVSSDSIYLWNHLGTTSVFSITSAEFTKEVYDNICKKINNYSIGIVDCSECKSMIEKKDIAGTYYAGVYCKKCWEGKWKEIERKHNYN